MNTKPLKAIGYSCIEFDDAVFIMQANSAGAVGNYDTAKTQNSWSICCSISAIVSVLVIPAVVVIVIVT